MRVDQAALATVLGLLCGAMAPTSSAFGQKCGCDKAPASCSACRCHHCRKLFQAPPQAPVLGSAPALMAPIIFTSAGPTAAPAAAPAAAPQLTCELVRELLKPLLESSAGCNLGRARGASGAPLAAPQPPPDESASDQLSRIDQRLVELTETLVKVDKDMGTALQKLTSRIEKIEGKSASSNQ